MKDDFGFYGKGLDGYVHYKQSVDRIGGGEHTGSSSDDLTDEERKEKYIQFWKKVDEENRNIYKDDPDWKEKLGEKFEKDEKYDTIWGVIFWIGVILFLGILHSLGS